MTKQNELIKYLAQCCIELKGMRAIYIKGSIARNTGDDYSDVDFYCLVEEDKVDDILKKRIEIIEGFKNVLFLEHVNFGLPQVIAIFEDNIHLDFYVGSNIPSEGTDSIRVIYDPDDLLSSYKVTKNEYDLQKFVKNINSIIYTFQEVYAAHMREDNLWTSRLLSHITTDLGLIYCALYGADKPVLHLKGIWFQLPTVIRDDLDEILSNMVPGKFVTCTNMIIEHTRKLIENKFSDYKDEIYLGYLEFVSTIFASL